MEYWSVGVMEGGEAHGRCLTEMRNSLDFEFGKG
jgi:hypothetical protein